MKYIFMLLIAAGAIGLIIILYYTVVHETFSNSQYNLACLTALLSMVFLLCGIHGFNECKKREP
jgi:hypothetical protein